jgi:hypothetical protein
MPRKQAGHMTAPDQQNQKKPLARTGPSTHDTGGEKNREKTSKIDHAHKLLPQ